MRLKIVCDGEWAVWAGLDEEDPEYSAVGFIVGLGKTQDEAVTEAIRALTDGITHLEQAKQS